MATERPVNPYTIKPFEAVTPEDVIEYLGRREHIDFDPYDKGINRSAAEYAELFQGLEHLFDYARTQHVRRVLDVGAGLTLADKQLAESPMGRDLEFLATVLTPRPEIEENLGFERTKVTSVEKLEGIEDESCAVVLGANSIGYSIDPEAAVIQIDRVLAPGGVLKATFMDSMMAGPPHLGILPKMNGHIPYSTILMAFGYNLSYMPPENYTGFDIVLAVKPGGKEDITAHDLMIADFKTYHSQIERLGGTPPVTESDFY